MDQRPAVALGVAFSRLHQALQVRVRHVACLDLGARRAVNGTETAACDRHRETADRCPRRALGLRDHGANHRFGIIEIGQNAGLDPFRTLETETGNMPNATIDGVTADPGVCDVLVGEDTNVPSTDPTFGDCRGADGNVGVTIKAAFHLCRTKCNGRTKVGVEMVGSFKLKKIYPTKSKNGQTPEFDKNEIQGVFVPTAAAGPVGPGPTTLTRLILVQ